MQKPEHHLMVCASFRTSGTPQGVCHKKGSVALLPYLETELSDRGLTGVSVCATGCLKACDRGPIIVQYPENIWYGGIDGEDQVDAILDALEKGETADEFILK